MGKLSNFARLLATGFSVCAINPALADIHHAIGSPDAHAPIGVMGDHLHKKGEWMVSYRFMRMEMDGNLQGEDDISAEQIVTTLNNPFMGPANVRVVPTEMTTDMHMLGLMYAPSDTVTLMAMVNYLDKEMDHLTFQGCMTPTACANNTNQIGEFTTEASGIGDTKVSALVKLVQNNNYNLHLNLGLSIPTGDIDEKDTVLTPMGMMTELVLPYAMQLGSGTWDLEPGFTYSGKEGKWGWGAQYKAIFRLDENDEDYTLGDQHKFTTWGSYRLVNWVSGSLRLTYTDLDSIDGQDSRIMAPVQTANPRNYGGERFDLGVGFNLIGQSGGIKNHRLALEYETPIENNVNGVQMEMEDMLTLGYQYAF